MAFKDCECGEHSFKPVKLGRTALCDVADSALLDKATHAHWHDRPSKHYMVVRGYGRGGKQTGMHRMVLGSTAEIVDHINGNGLDNRRANLRDATKSQNQQNRKRPNKNNKSGYKGVYWHGTASKWVAAITVESKFHGLGLYEKKEEAALAYNVAALRLYGEFAALNQIKEYA
jgi:HNH endonuclease/AP2 domain